jgi:hypothetical protein
VCSEPATYLGYDGRDPHEQRHPDTGRPYSVNAAHYQPQGAGGVVFGEPPAVGRVRAGERDDPAADGLEPGPDGGVDRVGLYWQTPWRRA